MRRPRTTNEMRASHDNCDGIITVRSKRKGQNLPNEWDDKPRGDYSHRSWKRHRHRQYRYKGEQMSEPRRTGNAA